MSKAVAQVTNWKQQTTLEPCGHRVLVRLKRVEEVTAGGIVLVDQTKDLEKKTGMEATVLAIGFQAWKTHAVNAVDESVRGVPWVKVGDTVQINRYSGTDAPDYIIREMGYDPKVDRIITINDDDVNNIIRRG